jgi:hypothetical protein
MAWRRGWCWLFIGLLLLPAGCAPPKNKRNSAAVKQDVVESFEALKVAIAELLDGHTDRLWDVLADRSQAEAAKKAKAFRADFAKREKEEQGQMAREAGATVDQLREKLNGFGYIRLMREALYHRYWMMATAEIDHIRLESEDEATVYYTLDDSEQEKKPLSFFLEDGQWKAVLRIP